MRSVADDRDKAYSRDLERLQDLIDREGVREHTRDFLQSVYDGCRLHKSPMTGPQREAVERIETQLDDHGHTGGRRGRRWYE
jgi:hypothetical protein